MKIVELLEVDRSDLEWAHSLERNPSPHQPNKALDGVWIYDKKSHRKLSGPFRDRDAAESFKRNRPDRIPADAVIR